MTAGKLNWEEYNFDDFLPAAKIKDDNVISFITNKINQINSEQFIDSDVLMVDFPEGKLVSIGCLKNKFYYTFDYKKVNENEKMSKWMESKIYPQLKKLSGQFQDLDFYTYGILNKNGLTFYDIYINQNFIDFYLVDQWMKAIDLKTPKILYEGIFTKEIMKKYNSFIVIKTPIILERKIAKKGQ